MADRHSMAGRYFEHFTLGEIIVHGVPRTLSEGDASLYQALYGARNPLFCARPVTQTIGLENMPLDSWLVFHIIFGKTVADISRHAVANLGYAQGVFHAPVFVGDTLSARSEVIGLRQNKSGESGLVMVRTSGMNQHGETVLSYVRWVMVKKRDTDGPAPATVWPDMSAPLAAAQVPPPQGDFSHWQADFTGSEAFFDDYQTGMKISHGDGTTLEEAEHMMATRLYQNNAAVHFDAHMQSQSRFGKRLIYGGHIMSHVASMAFNGLGNLAGYAGLNSGSHTAPCFAGDTLYGWSEILEKAAFDGRDDVGALRLRHIVLKNHAQQAENGDFIDKTENGDVAEEVVLELDIWAYMPRHR